MDVTEATVAAGAAARAETAGIAVVVTRLRAPRSVTTYLDVIPSIFGADVWQKIVVERLSKNINEEHLYEIFGQFGPVKDLDLPMNRTCKLTLNLRRVAVRFC